MEFNVVEESGKTREMYVLKEPAVRKGKSGGQGAGTPCEIKVGLTLGEDPPRIVLRSVDKSDRGSMVAVLTPESASRIAGALQNVVKRLNESDGAMLSPPWL